MTPSSPAAHAPQSTNRVALVTGASRGIGQATALELQKRGYRLCVTATAESALQGLAGQLRAAGAKDTLVVAGDLIDVAFAESLVRRTVDQFGRLDVLVNNAAWRELVTMRQITQESWDKTLRICLTAPAFLAKRAAEVMEAQRGGVIINVSSIMSILANGIAPAYVAAKGGLDALTYDLAALYGPSNVRVVAVNPGAIDTEMGNDYVSPAEAEIATKVRRHSEEMIALGRWGRADEIARTIAMLASDDASYITGTTVIVDGGWSHQLEPRNLKRLFKPDQF